VESVERERVEVVRGTEREGSRDERERRENSGGTVSKRNLDERSPGQHEDIRTNRPRLDEFDVGTLCVRKLIEDGWTDR
jgi:hypothetical protein